MAFREAREFRERDDDGRRAEERVASARSVKRSEINASQGTGAAAPRFAGNSQAPPERTGCQGVSATSPATRTRSAEPPSTTVATTHCTVARPPDASRSTSPATTASARSGARSP